MSAARKLLLQQEKNNVEDLETKVRDAIADAWMSGPMYFRGRPIAPKDQGASFAIALQAAAARVLPELFPHFVATQVLPAELLQLIDELPGPSPKFVTGELGILELDKGRYVPACNGIVPQRVQQYIEAEGGLAGASLLAHFGRPPYGTERRQRVWWDCCAPARCGSSRTAAPHHRHAGRRRARLLERTRFGAPPFACRRRRSAFRPARICLFSELGVAMDREDHAIAEPSRSILRSRAACASWKAS